MPPSAIIGTPVPSSALAASYTAGKITVGQFFSLNIYSFFIFGPLQEMGNVINAYREAQVSLANYEAIFNLPVEQKPENPYSVQKIDSLEFQEVKFRHQTASKDALRKISFRVQKGTIRENLLFVNPTATDEQCLDVLKKAACQSILDRAEKGLDTVLAMRNMANAKDTLVLAKKEGKNYQDD
ncbi:hypothetical protein B566_EDAN018716, partial [Ephemera danica]